MRSCSATRNQLGRSFHNGRGHGDGDAGRRDRPLDRRQHRQFFRGGVLRKGRAEGRIGQIDQAMVVGRELGRLRMRLGRGRTRRRPFRLRPAPGGDIDERLHLLAPRRRDHGAGIGVAGEHDRPGDPLQRAIERRDIVLRTRSAAAAPPRP